MEQLRTKKCVYCGYYEGYYTRKLHRYERTNKGYCKKHDKIVLNGETCERWQNNASRRALCRRAVSRELYENGSFGNPANISRHGMEEKASR